MKRRYAEGLEWMIDGGGLPQVMYIACIISEFLILAKLEPSNIKDYTMILGVNIILVYFLCYMYYKYYVVELLSNFKLFIFVVSSIILINIMGGVVGTGKVFIIFIVPIVISFLTIGIDECTCLLDNIYDNIQIKNINKLYAIIIANFLPTIVIVIPLIFLEWNPLVKVTIIFGYMFSSPLISFASLNDFSIFSAIGFEW